MSTVTQHEKQPRKAAIAAWVGSSLEYYDFFVYGNAAALVFGAKFFPSLSPLAGSLAAFSTFTVGFLARPLGGVVMGHFGDRIGRKSMLVASLMIMGVATFLIGLLPTYAQVGVWAPRATGVASMAAFPRWVFLPGSYFQISSSFPSARCSRATNSIHGDGGCHSC